LIFFCDELTKVKLRRCKIEVKFAAPYAKHFINSKLAYIVHSFFNLIFVIIDGLFKFISGPSSSRSFDKFSIGGHASFMPV